MDSNRNDSLFCTNKDAEPVYFVPSIEDNSGENYFEVCLITAAVTIALFFSWVMFSFFEAKASNQLTNRNVTTVQVMFIDLQVIETMEK